MILKSKLLLVISFYSLSQTIFTKSLSILSFNIDTNSGKTEEGYARDAFPELRINNRMPRIKKALTDIIQTYSPDVIQLQEGRDFITKFGDRVEGVEPLVLFLREQGYNVSTQRYNSSEKAMTYITATKPKFVIDGHSAKYMSKTENQPTDRLLPLAEIKENNFGEEFERCVFITKMHDGRNQYYVFNIHMNMTLNSRLESCKLLKKWTHELIDKDPKVKIIMAGDFNTFPQSGGSEQIEIMVTDSKLDEVTKVLSLPNGKRSPTSFIAFLSDFSYHEQEPEIKAKISEFMKMDPQTRRLAIIEIFTNNCEAFGHALGGHLDRVFQYGFKSGRSILLPTPQFKDFDIDKFSDKYVKEFMLRHANDNSPAFASDHQPVLTVLEF